MMIKIKNNLMMKRLYIVALAKMLIDEELNYFLFFECNELV